MARRILLSHGFLGAACALIVLSLALVFAYVPTEKEMGVVQRIFYFHVPLAWDAFLAFFLVFVFSIMYLVKRKDIYDVWAYSSAEVGVVFTTLVLITGPIWAKPVWGTWWTWDTRLTTTLVLWLIYIAYLMVRSFATDESRGARFGAVIGIVGFIDVPIVALAIQLWRTQHPGPSIFTGGIAPPMMLTLMVCVVTFTLIYLRLMADAVALREMKKELQELRQGRDVDKE